MELIILQIGQVHKKKVKLFIYIDLAGTISQAPVSNLTMNLPQLTSGVSSPIATKTNPASFDWISLNKVSAVKNQGSCGGCWTFGTTGLF